MIFKRSLLFNLILGFIVASLILAFSQKGFLKRLELDSLDLSFFLRGARPTHSPIVIIEITDNDIASIGRWPWKRSWHAAMVEALAKLEAKFIYFDIIFSEPSTEEDDDLLAKAITQNKNVYLPFVFQDFPYNIDNALLPIEKFSKSIKGTGSINVYPDSDGTIRRIPLVFPTKDKMYFHAALQLAMDYNNLKLQNLKPSALTLADRQNKINIPFAKKNEMLINWSGPWSKTFKHYSFLQVLSAYQDILDGNKPKIDLKDFKNSICLVAVTAIGLYDINSIPLQPEYPGIGIIANTIDNILEKDFLYHPPVLVNILILYMLCIYPAFLIFGEKPLRETIFVALTAMVYFLTVYVFFKFGVVIELSYPMIGLFTSYLSIGTYNFVRVSVERQNFFKMSVTDGLTGLFNIRYFKMLLETEIFLAKPNPDQKFAIVMSDVDHFKHFNDTYGHQVGDLVLKEVANAIKTTVRSSDIVARYGGEEMIVLLRGANIKEGLVVAEKIRKNIESTELKDQNNSYKVTASFGVSTFKVGDDVDAIIKRADQGLYKAKEAGRNRVCAIEEQ